MRTIARIAPDLGWLPISFVNVYFVGRPGGPWVLIDAGIPGRANQILEAAEARFGAGAAPEAILLTHGHADHAGSALELANAWDVPIYAHRLERPYLTGKSNYPPADPTVGGAMAFLSRFTPSRARDFGSRIQDLRSNELPGLPGWELVPTPGHSPGHVCFFRPSDRVLLAGDAFATMNMDSWSGLITGKRTLARAGTPFTTDWETARQSVMRLAKLRPNVVGCGYGIPRCDAELPAELERFAERFCAPRTGRYVRQPARTDERGVVSVPPAPFDIVPFATAGALILAGIALGAGYLDEKLRK
jgi:glyoxylase-like metal-dependent hydrolase (beta-lactamase superfamily II)